MHEFALCRALLNAVERIVQREGAVGVCSLTVTVGALSGVEPLLLARAFEIARASTVAKDALLNVIAAPVRIFCQSCGLESEVPTQRLLCTHCTGSRVQILTGDELVLSRVELEVTAASHQAADRDLQMRS